MEKKIVTIDIKAKIKKKQRAVFNNIRDSKRSKSFLLNNLPPIRKNALQADKK